MNNTNPEDLFYEQDCPFELLSLDDFELSLLEKEVWE